MGSQTAPSLNRPALVKGGREWSNGGFQLKPHGRRTMVRNFSLWPSCVAGALVAMAGAAYAETPAISVQARAEAALMSPSPTAARPALRLSAFTIAYARPDAPTAPGVAKTSVDHRFGSDGVVGSVGYLCGVNSVAPGADEQRGPASAYGGGSTYLGAKLSYAFH